jgi:DNA-binding transcriptional regulator YhcF (GntR family)
MSSLAPSPLDGWPLPSGALSATRQLKYRQIESAVRKLAETLPVDAKMPTERELATTFGCSVLTIRKGLQALVDEGIIRRIMGSGTFVEPHSGAPVRAENTVCILTCAESDSYAYRLLQSVAQETLSLSLEPRSVWIRGFGPDSLARISLLRQEGCKAFTLPWFPLDREQEVFRFVKDAGGCISLPQPIVGLESCSFVRPDLYGVATMRAIESLCSYFELLGCEHIAFLAPDSPNNTILQRQLVAYASAMSRHNRSLTSCLVGPTAKAIDELAKRWSVFAGKLGVISYDDEHALRLMTAMHKLGLNAPCDFRIVGYNNTDSCHFSDPPLSTVAQSFDFIAKWLVRSAKALGQGKVDQAQENPDCFLIVRGTCGGSSVLEEKIQGKIPGLSVKIERQSS